MQCSKRYAAANNAFVEEYDCTKPDSYIMYFDANNLYGWAMSNPMPLKDFQWLEESAFDEVIQIVLNRASSGLLNGNNITSIQCENDEYGYILEVTLDYPQHLHNLHKDLPLLPHHFNSPTSSSPNQKKLMTTL